MLESRETIISSFLVAFLLACCGPGFTARAQTPALIWADHYGSSEAVEVEGVAVDGSGNVILAGYFNGTMTFAGLPLVSAGSADIFLAKFNADGAYLWGHSFGDAGTQYAFGVTVDDAGNILLTGGFYGEVSFGPIPLSSSGLSDIYVAKFDGFGNLIWARSYGDAESQHARPIVVDSSGNILLSGFFNGSVDFGGPVLTCVGDNDIFLAKFDAQGNHLWSDRFGDADRQYGRGLAVDGADNVILTGYYQGGVDFGGGPLPTADAFDAYIAKFAPDGQLDWSAGFGGAERQYTECVAVDGADNIIVAGFFAGALDFGGGPLTSAGQYDICLAKFDGQGNHIWSDRFGDASPQLARGLAVDSWGDIIITGKNEGTADFGGGPLVSAGDEDVFVVKFDVGGDHIWSLGAGDESGQRGHCLAVDGPDHVLAAGTFSGAVDFGDGPLETDRTDIFLAKFGWTASGIPISSGEAQPELRSFPNPFNPTTTISYRVPNAGLVRLRIYDIQGRLVRTLVNETQTAGEYALPWDGCDRNGAEVGSGVYFLRLEAAGQPRSFKLVTLK